MTRSVNGTTISMTRGDTVMIRLDLTMADGSPYEPEDGDSVRFALKRSCADAAPLLVKQIPTSTMVLELLPEDTKKLSFGSYVYDLELTTASGYVDTFVPKARLKITEEVY